MLLSRPSSQEFQPDKSPTKTAYEENAELRIVEVS
ncbi:hypothetical protein MUK42_33570 [Musa troglodytarum]|uniref:Uncharacterized protein n=1 Tax=Musa troglodytarum TaxID=320322 RepID=A0A9E7JRU5_9LILI|nr:hypothetical protein MUK42_33570 [Musa troglodytarum]